MANGNPEPVQEYFDAHACAAAKLDWRKFLNTLPANLPGAEVEARTGAFLDRLRLTGHMACALSRTGVHVDVERPYDSDFLAAARATHQATRQ